MVYVWVLVGELMEIELLAGLALMASALAMLISTRFFWGRPVEIVNKGDDIIWVKIT